MSNEWFCPFCSHRLQYGKHCPNIEASKDRHYSHAETCDRGEKNVVWETVKRAKPFKSDGVGLGISEIANNEGDM